MASETAPVGDAATGDSGTIRVDSAGGGYFASMEGVHEMVAWVKERIRVAGYNPTMWDARDSRSDCVRIPLPAKHHPVNCVCTEDRHDEACPLDRFSLRL